MMIDPEGLRDQLGDMLSTEISDPLWQHWTEQGYIREILRDKLAFNDAIQTLQKAVLAYTGQPQGLLTIHATAVLGAQADVALRDLPFEDLVAQEAGQELAVQAFRDEVLQGKLVHQDQLVKWLVAQGRAERTMDMWVCDARISPADQDVLRRAIETAEQDAPAHQPVEQSIDVTVQLTPDQLPWQLSLRILHCRLQSADSVYHVPVTEGRVLDRLRRLAVYLAPRYGWEEADAVNFVLTGASQPAPRIRSEVTLVDQLPVMSRITLSIDPSMKPSEVARYYEEVRAEITSTRPRELSEKHVQLAHFTTVRPEGQTWRQRMEAWNQQHPEWAYEQETNFARDAMQAKRRLLYPDYHAPTDTRWRVKHIHRSEEHHGQAGQ